MAKALECIQGDSFSYDFSTDAVELLDDNWTGQWAIVDAIPPVEDAFASGTIVVSSDYKKMELRILEAHTTPLPVATYYLVAQLSNATIGYNQEVMQREFKILAQGIS